MRETTPIGRAPLASAAAAVTSACSPVSGATAESGPKADARNISHPPGKKGIRVAIALLGEVTVPGSFRQRRRGEAAAAVGATFLRDVKRMIEGSGPRNG